MSDKLKNRFEKILQLIEQLITEVDKGALIVVEGQSDIRALKQLAIQGNTISVKTAGKSFLDILTEIEEQNMSEAILLLDFDRRGKEWTKRLQQRLEEKRIKVNVSFWKKLHALVGREVKDVEGLPTYLETLKKRISD
ncbi:MAG: toprim domain-containing protein [Candidatus Bathyarchaeota archaeon]